MYFLKKYTVLIFLYVISLTFTAFQVNAQSPISNYPLGKAYTKYSGVRYITTSYSVARQSYVLIDSLRNIEANEVTFDQQDGSQYNTWISDLTNLWNTDSAYYDGFFNLQQSYDFYLHRYGRSGYDNNNSHLFFEIYVDEKNPIHAHNDEITVGAVFPGSFRGPQTNTQYVAREYTRAILENVIASSAGNNEVKNVRTGLCNIMGVVIDSIVNSGTDYWKIGDELLVNNSFAVARDISDPLAGHFPDTYQGHYYTATGDISMIAEHWFYILSQGKTGRNDNGDIYSVKGIGMLNVADMVYRYITTYNTSTAQYSYLRDFTIQAAKDLFGNCSEEVKQCTNAWYAVGIGAPYSEAITADFITDKIVSCGFPATVNFTALTANATGFEWDFGDLSSSVLQNPAHTYAAAGSYNVKLIVTGSSFCNSSDTIIKTGLITVFNGSLITPASCPLSVATNFNHSGVGIYAVDFASVSNRTGNNDINTDYSCRFQVNAVAGDSYPVKITTGSSVKENVSAWIDFNNNGIFDLPAEEVFKSDSTYEIHQGIIHIPVTAVTGIPLRIRIWSDEISTIPSPCNQPVSGQCEDYSILLSTASAKPVADFDADKKYILPGSTVNFSDLSVNGASSFTWFFTGGNPSVSSLQNPSVVYNGNGYFAVTLIAENAFGKDTITKQIYINVVDTNYMCGFPSSTASAGVLFDTGGENGNYQDNENCYFGILNPAGGSIIIEFDEFNLSDNDFIELYDVWNSNNPLLKFSATNVPHGEIFFPGDRCMIRFSSDCCGNNKGFRMHWRTDYIGADSLIVDFTVDTIPPLGETVYFNPVSNYPITKWQWTFGDGDSSKEKNPSHIYETSGLMEAKLIASNYYASDTVIKYINVQQAPLVTLSKDTLFIDDVTCGEIVDTVFYVSNSGNGDLVIHFNNNYAAPSQRAGKILGLFGRDIPGYLPTIYLNDALELNGLNYELNTRKTDSTAQFEQLINSNDLLLSFPGSVFSNPGPLLLDMIRNYIFRGGTLMGFESDKILEALLPGGNATGVVNYYLNTNPSHPLVKNMADTVRLNGTSVYKKYFNDSNYVNLLQNGAASVLGYASYGKGTIIFNAAVTPYKAFGDSILVNAAKWIKDKIETGSSVYTDSLQTITIHPGDSAAIALHINTASFTAGDTLVSFYFGSNDTSATGFEKFIKLHMEGDPLLTLSDSLCHSLNVNDTIAINDSILISNMGCDTLHLSNVTVGVPFYLVDFPSAINPSTSAYIHLYCIVPPATGTYTSTMLIENDDRDTVICLAANANVPVALFSNATDETCGNEKVLINQSLYGNLYEWNFGDGTFSTSPGNSISHIYQTNGTFTVTLTAHSPFGTGTYSDTVNVYIVPGNILMLGAVIANAQIQFRAVSLQSGTTAQWDFNDNTALVPGAIVNHLFPQIGNYHVTLYLTDIDGCMRSIDTTITLTTAISVAENTSANAITVSPNPFKEQTSIVINLAKKSSLAFSVYSAEGKLISKIDKTILNPGTQLLETGKLAPGFYFLTVNVDDTVYSFKLVSID